MDESDLRVDQRVRRSVKDVFREAFITGMAVVVPLFITIIVLAIAFQYVHQYLSLFAELVIVAGRNVYVPYFGDIPLGQLAVEVLTPLVLAWLILFVGVVINSSRWGERAIDYFDYVIAQIPGVGSVYESFRQMSDVVLESDTQNFREVKLVEFPHEGAYTLGFVTTETPAELSDPAGHNQMLTLFLPLAPNPVMGGHLVHMPAEKVMDVDMTVEEGIRAVVTSGVAVGGGGGGSAGISEERLRELAGIEHADQQLNPGMDSPDLRRDEEVDTDRSEQYDAAVAPERASTPSDIARRERPGEAAGERESAVEHLHGVDVDDTQVTPAEEAGRYTPEADETDERPAAKADRDAEEREPTENRPAEMAGRDPEDRDSTERRPAEMAGRDAEEREPTDTRPAEVTGDREDDEDGDDDEGEE